MPITYTRAKVSNGRIHYDETKKKDTQRGASRSIDRQTGQVEDFPCHSAVFHAFVLLAFSSLSTIPLGFQAV